MIQCQGTIQLAQAVQHHPAHEIEGTKMLTMLKFCEIRLCNDL